MHDLQLVNLFVDGGTTSRTAEMLRAQGMNVVTEQMRRAAGALAQLLTVGSLRCLVLQDPEGCDTGE